MRSFILLLLLLPSYAMATLVLSYNFDDGTAVDSSGFGNHGSVNGATAAAGIVGQGLSFDGSNDNVTTPLDIDTNVMPQLTMGAWVKPNDTSSLRAILTHDDGGFDRQLTIETRGNGSPADFAAFSGTGVLEDSRNLGFNPNQFYFVAVAYDQSLSQMRLYVGDENNAVFESTATTGFGSNISDSNLLVGSRPASVTRKEFFNGVIDEVFVFDEALSAGEIENLRSSAVVPEPSSIIMLVSALFLCCWKKVAWDYCDGFFEAFGSPKKSS